MTDPLDLKIRQLLYRIDELAPPAQPWAAVVTTGQDRAAGHDDPVAESADHSVQFEPDEGDLIMVDIQTRDTDADRQAEKTRRKWLPYTVLAAAAVTVVVGAVVLFSDSEESTPVDVVDNPADTDAPVPTEQVESPAFGAESSLAVVDDYFAAHNAGDIDSFFGLFTDDAMFADNWTDPVNLTDWKPRLAWDLAQGETLTSPQCTVIDEVPGEAVTVSCEHGTHDAVGLAVGSTLIPTTTRMTITPNGINDVNETYGRPDFTQTGNPFTRWMEANHPEDAEAAGCCEGDTVEESVARGELRAQYAREWADYLEANDCVSYFLSC